MSSPYEIELSEPVASLCECCGGLTVRLTRFVCREGASFAVYYAAYSNNHPDTELGMLVSLGDWAEEADPGERAAFYCRIRPTDDSYQVMLGDAASSRWSDAEIMGRQLSREDALRHPLKATAFEVLDEAFLRDPSLTGFMHRAHSGDLAVPLERNFFAPDDIFALGSAMEERAEVRKNFASLDGSRFFVRTLLPIPVEGYEAWSVGLWVEVSKADHDRVKDAWDDPAKYAALRYSGAVANDVRGDLGLPVALGSAVDACVTDPDGMPSVVAPAAGPLAALLTKAWPRASFEEFAVRRGFL